VLSDSLEQHSHFDSRSFNSLSYLPKVIDGKRCIFSSNIYNINNIEPTMIINISHYVHFLNAKIIDSSSCFNIGCYPAAIIKKNVEGLIVYAGPTIE
jgi:hypothetical protein